MRFEHILTVSCPFCGAHAGRPCGKQNGVNRGEAITVPHIRRIDAYRAERGAKAGEK